MKVVIIGGGIAGASLAWALAERGVADVVVLEREPRPGLHATGRSAAALVEFATDPVRARLLRAGGEALRHPSPRFSDRPLLRATGILELVDDAGWRAAAAAAPFLTGELGVALELIGAAEVRARFPEITAPGVAGGVWLPACGRIDVAALLDGFVDGARRMGVDLRCGAEVRELRRGPTGWTVTTAAGELDADVVVDAAGAWVGPIAALAGALPIRFSTRRRTVILFDAPPGRDLSGWPLVAFDAARFYIGPEDGGLIASPMDEDPVDPCDAAPDPAVVAAAVDQVARLATPLAPARLRGARAGLRTFAPDERLVIGADPRQPGFFWLAGQGGWGIETSFAAARLAAELIATGATDWPDAAALSPLRFARS